MTSRNVHGGVVLALIPTVAAATLALVGLRFRASPDAELYARAADRAARQSEDGPELMRALIDRDELTWDPTGGIEMQTVVTHLKAGRGERVLLLGSSQLIMQRDDRTMGSVAYRVDKALEKVAARPVTVYNLSVVGMSAPEKAIVLEHATRAVRFDDVVVALTLYDSVLRARQGRIDRLASASRRTGEPFGASDDRSGPAAVNRHLAAFLRRLLSESVAFFRDRAAIQAWLGNRPPRPAAPVPAPVSIADARPMQYHYSDEDLSRAVANVQALFHTTAALRDRDGFRVSILLTPFRQDIEHPAYDPQAYAGFRASVREDCRRLGFDLIDASELLDPSHFSPEDPARVAGPIDVLHFDGRGHEILAGVLAREIGLNGSRLVAASPHRR
jgi:hypothetical protein